MHNNIENMTFAIHPNAVVSDTASLQHAARAALRGTSTTILSTSQAVPSILAKTAATAVAVGVTGLVAAAAIWSIGIMFNAILPKSYKDYKKRAGH